MKKTVMVFALAFLSVFSVEVMAEQFPLLGDIALTENTSGRGVFFDGTGEFAVDVIFGTPSSRLPVEQYVIGSNVESVFTIDDANLDAAILNASAISIIGDEFIRAVVTLKDYGTIAKYAILLNTFGISGTQIANGQSAPDSAWREYPMKNNALIVDWPKGRPFEFSYGINDGSQDSYFDPCGLSQCSNFTFPKEASSELRHFKIIPGENESCPQSNTGDNLVKAIVDLGNGVKRIYLDFSSLPMTNYQKIAVMGQSAPDSAWIEYPVVDANPCYYVDIANYPSGEFFEFSYYVIAANGVQQWVDPSLSTLFHYLGHLRLVM